MALAGALDRNEAASVGVRRRDDALLALGLFSAVTAVVLCSRRSHIEFVPEPDAHIAAALFSLFTGAAVLLACWDRAAREPSRGSDFRLLAIGGGIAFGGQSVGYLATAGYAGPFLPWIEAVPLAIGGALAGWALYRICWPEGLGAADARSLALDVAVTALAVLVIWSTYVVPKWMYPENDQAPYAFWERVDQAVMLLVLTMTLLVGVLSRRVATLPWSQIALVGGGMLVTILSDVLGQTWDRLDAESSITYSIVGYVVGASLIVAGIHRPPVEHEGPAEARAREWTSLLVPTVAAGLALLSLVALGFDELDAGPTAAVTLLVVLFLAALLVTRVRAYRDLRRVQTDTARQLLADRTRDGWFRALVGDSREYVFVVDRVGTIVYASPRVETDIALHDTPQPFDPSHLHNLVEVVEEASTDEVALLLAQVALDPSKTGPFELRMRGHGGILDVEASFRALTDIEFEGFVVTARDVTAARHLQRELELSKNRDGLTGLLNREGFLAAVSGRTLDHGDLPCAVLVFDIERFAALNDGLGHDTGDDILRAIAASFARLPWYVADEARLSSDAFALLVVSADPEEAVGEVVEQARDELRGLVLPDGREVEVTFRAGFVVAPVGDERAADWLLEAADLALARARSSRNAMLVEYHDDMRAETERRIAVERDLRDALATGRVEVHYQPIVRLQDNVVTGSEALVRLRGVDGRLVPPGDFIPLAEEIGLIDDIGLLVLREACAQTVAASALLDRALTISVNLAVDQLRPDIVDEVRLALRASHLPADRLTLEITESTLADLSTRTQNVLNDLRALGVRVALDDFGTGYSSMSYLAALPVDILKIDRSFVSVLGSSESGFTLARLVVQLAEPLRMRTVAEGIETIEQADLLRGMGCQYGQGFLFARPMPFDDFVEALRGPLGATVGL